MRRLILLRHAETEASHPAGDRARALTAQGRDDAIAIGAWLRAQNLMPDGVLVSPAQRTRETRELALGDAPADTRIQGDLYLAEAQTLVDCIRAADERAVTLLLIAHNPGIGVLAAELAGDENRSGPRDDYPTCACAVFDCAIATWSALAPGVARLVAFMTPARLAAASATAGVR